MENRSHAFIAGAFVLCLSAAVLVALWWFGQGSQQSKRYLLETKGSVPGLNVQAQVRYRGIRAGKVEKIAPDPSNPRVIQVLISLDERFSLTKAATAQLAYQGLTGAAQVVIDDDGSSSELIESVNGQPPRIQLRAGTIEGLFERATHVLGQLSLFSTRMNQLLDDKSTQSIKQSIDNLNVASEGLRELPKTMAALREMVSTENLARLNKILVQLEKLGTETAPATAEFREMVRSFTVLSKKIDTLSATIGEDISNEALPATNQLLREAQSTARQLARLLEGLEGNPQMLIFGRDAHAPGPGEQGYVVQP
jgi:phospholipid/cholesterol/gamma-HCH transport system substrate-binding protein